MAPTNQLIVGPSGSGKHLFATQAVVNALAQNMPVVILDVGRSYWPLANMLGGSCSVLNSGKRPETVSFGSRPLVVYELENLGRESIGSLPNLPTAEGARGLILVDEMSALIYRYPGLPMWLRQQAQAGFSVCIVMQSLSVGYLPQLPDDLHLLTVAQHGEASHTGILNNSCEG